MIHVTFIVKACRRILPGDRQLRDRHLAYVRAGGLTESHARRIALDLARRAFPKRQGWARLHLHTHTVEELPW